MKKLPRFTFAVTSIALATCGLILAVGGLPTAVRLVAQEKDAAKSAEPSPPVKAGPTAPEPVASKPSQAEADAAAAGAALLKKSRDALISFGSIKADIREVVAIGGRRVETTGTYLQGTNLKLRLEFAVRLGDQEGALSGSVLQVCNGHTLWTVQQIGDPNTEKPTITRRNVREILAAAKESAAASENMLIAELGLGGLPAILASLEQSMVFRSVQKEDVRGKVLTVVEGTWKPEKREQFLKQLNTGQKEKTDRLPTHIPDSVQVYLDPENGLFPRRIVYRKQDATRDFTRPMVTIAFAEIVLNGPVDEQAFEFVAPEGVPQDDITARYTDNLRPRSSPQAPSTGSGATTIE
ncbi:MAG: hypothetical protein WD648_16150 [Planctomycetaceae bacterium]